MIPRISSGWQTTMADLALILFMVSVAGLYSGHGKGTPAGPMSARAEPIAVYSARDGAPPLVEWLAEQAPDSRQHLTIVARYRRGKAASAARKALELAEQSGAAGYSARLVIEPGEKAEVLALLAYDRPAEAVAQTLQSHKQD